jgi:hypothetical protein
VRGVVVVTGKNNAQLETWELAGTTWTQGGTPTFVGALAYDQELGSVIAAAPNQLARYLGGLWVSFSPFAPPALDSMAIASDPIRGRVVMFGGGCCGDPTVQASATLSGATYEWDGRGWTMPTPAITPSARTGAAMAYDTVTGHVLLFGGENGGGVLGDTWEWDGTTWTPIGGPQPPARSRAAIATDTSRGRIALFGGYTTPRCASASCMLGDTWEWNGTTWAEISVAGGPSPRAAPAMAYDAAHRVIVLAGGTTAYSFSPNPKAETWTWDGLAWTEQTSSATPARFGHSLVFDRARRQISLFGGHGGNASPWEWDGSTWIEESSLTQLTPLFSAGGVYDNARSEMLEVGGLMTQGPQGIDIVATWTGSFLGTPEESCAAGIDLNGNGLAGCADPDCAFVCEPACLDPTGLCISGPSCGDGACDGLETDRTCPADCPPAPAVCGDGWCSPGEAATCPADC